MKSSNARLTLAAIALVLTATVPALSHARDRGFAQQTITLGSVIGGTVANRDSTLQVDNYSHRDDRRTQSRHGFGSQRYYDNQPRRYGHYPAPAARGYKPHLPHRTDFVPGFFQTRQANHVRQGPGRNFRSIGVLPAGTPVRIVRNSARNNWVLVAQGYREIGYVYAEQLYKAHPYSGNWNQR